MERNEKHSNHALRIVVDSPYPLASQPPPRRFFTFNDVISGVVTLDVFKEMSVKNIQVKIAGHASTQITRYVMMNNGRDKEVEECSNHEILYDVVTLFPPQNVKQVSSSTKFTLVPGRYEYPFALRLPVNGFCGDPQSRKLSNLYTSKFESSWRQQRATDSQKHRMSLLPPSFRAACPSQSGESSDIASVYYSIKVSLHKGDFFSVSTRLTDRLLVLPPGPTMAELSTLETTSGVTNSIRIRNGVKIRVKMKTPQVLISAYSQDVQLFLQTSSPTSSPPVIEHLTLSLIRVCTALTKSFTSEIQEESQLVALQRVSSPPDYNPCGDSGFSSQLNLSSLLDSMDISKVSPSFQTCNMENRYLLSLTCSVEANMLQISVPVIVGGALVDDEERAMIFGCLNSPSSVTLPNGKDYPPRMTHRPMSTESVSRPVMPQRPGQAEEPPRPPMPQRPQQEEQLPSYQEALAASSGNIS